MTKLNIIKNLKQIQKLLEEDSPMIAKERIKFLINDIGKDVKTITEDDIKYRQGRSRRQEENNEKLMLTSSIILAVLIFGIVIYGIISG